MREAGWEALSVLAIQSLAAASAGCLVLLTLDVFGLSQITSLASWNSPVGRLLSAPAVHQLCVENQTKVRGGGTTCSHPVIIVGDK